MNLTPPSKFLLAPLLVSAWVLGLGGISFYTPAMTSIQHDLAVTPLFIKLTITFFILGKAISMVLAAPFADHFARKKLFLFGLSLFTLGSMVCLVGPTIWLLLLGRFIEGLGISICILMGRSLVNDQYRPNQAANLFSIIFIGNALAITLLPILSGYVTSFLNWRFIFLILTVYGFSVIALIYYLLPKNNHDALAPINFKYFFTQSGLIILHPAFIGFMLSLGLIDSGEKILTTVAPFVFIDKLGFSHIYFGYLQGALWGAHLIGLALCGVLVLKQKLNHMILIGSLICIVAAILMIIAACFSDCSFIFLITGMFVFMLSTGFIVPTSLVGVAHPFPKMIGLATALAMSIEFFMGAVLTAIISYLKNYDLLIIMTMPMTVGIGIFMCWFFLLKDKG